MTTTPLPPQGVAAREPGETAPEGAGSGRRNGLQRRASIATKKLSSPWASLIAVVIALLWTTPTIGLLVTSFRPEIDIRSTGWWTIFSNPSFTTANYEQALFGGSQSLWTDLINTIVITLPAVVIPISIALLAAYGFAWIDFKGRNFLFVAIFALQIVPIQVTLIPLLTTYVDLGINGTFWSVWLSHTMFALPLAIFLLHNFMKDIPPSLVEAARVDGAGHVKIFFRVLLPLLVPAIASFAIFQFLWVWNDLLVALTFASGLPNVRPLTVRIAELVGSRGGDWFLLSAGAFVSMIVPMLVFLFLQRYFVRGLLAGSVKG
ncbi:carbohydrate ABC transporter permease [Cellulomonas carbonis]|uniref:Sugar ABC transporter permease n=1 Tax=Cellulomonas carbonis T26 TaxID=947969 RepID=A0A0A0BUA7_9CELL|nr:carbohydrate ABC transporter permease [Cellulomonas carbonis]KGM10709.1 sugar ABC transporter permease [Cellulomonas carbonis T26]GGC02859.1 sugar ABC transporter permease [Cellulomonas carbonis]